MKIIGSAASIGKTLRFTERYQARRKRNGKVE